VTIGTSSTGNLRYQDARYREGLLQRAALVLFLLVGAAIFFVWSHSKVIGMGAKLSDLYAKRLEVLEDNQRLSMERLSLRNVNRVEAYARSRLGMVYPAPSEIRFVREP